MADPVILLVHQCPASWYNAEFRDYSTSPPLGLLYLTSYLRRAGHRVEVVDLVVEKQDRAEFASYLKRLQPYLVGVSCTTQAINAGLQTCSFVKQHLPNARTVLGGAHPTVEYESVLQDSHVDYVIRHEGEIPLERLATQLLEPSPDLGAIKGLCWRQCGRAMVNENQPFIEDLDQLPGPARDLLEVGPGYSFPGTISSSRGCPSKCVFCAAGALTGGEYRYHSAARVFDEVRDLHEQYGIQDFLFVDDTFTVKRKRAIEICRRIIDAGLKLTFTCESRVSLVDPEFLGILKRAGCRLIQYGMESGSNDVLKRIRKGITTEQIRQVVAWTREAGIHMKGSFIIGHAWDTPETVACTFRFMRELKERHHVEVYPALNIPFPGTEQFIRREELGLSIHTDNWDDFNYANAIISVPNMSQEELRKTYSEMRRYASEHNRIWGL